MGIGHSDLQGPKGGANKRVTCALCKEWKNHLSPPKIEAAKKAGCSGKGITIEKGAERRKKPNRRVRFSSALDFCQPALMNRCKFKENRIQTRAQGGRNDKAGGDKKAKATEVEVGPIPRKDGQLLL